METQEITPDEIKQLSEAEQELYKILRQAADHIKKHKITAICGFGPVVANADQFEEIIKAECYAEFIGGLQNALATPASNEVN